MKKLLLIALGVVALLTGVWAERSWAADSYTIVGNANYTMTNTDVRLVPTVALTANRTWTLPFANATCIGQSCAPGANTLDIIDAQGNVGGANSCIIVAPPSGNTINGASGSVTFCGTYGRIAFWPMSGSNWTYNLVAAGQTPGTTTNDNASTGNVGEFVTVAKTLATAKAATTNSSITLGSVSLTAGDWDCRGIMSEALSATTTATALSASISGTDGVMGTQGTEGTTTFNYAPVSATLYGPNGIDLRVGPVRESLATTTTLYFVTGATFATSGLYTYGTLSCRRVR